MRPAMPQDTPAAGSSAGASPSAGNGPGMPKQYDPSAVEDKWYTHWMRKGYFRSVPDDREPFTIVIPPPNVTGVLHMGHILNNTIQDILVRRARMQGKNALWVPGTDHASIATEAKVVRKLREEGIRKADLSRDEFLTHAWAWTEKHGGIILDQLKKLGASCDWDRTRFTMEESLSDAVIDVFIDLYRKGYIYRGLRMVNWDPEAQTALSNEEVIYRDVTDQLYYVRYRVAGEDRHVTVATTRPETIMGDVAVCFHPEDPRYADLKGKTLIVPLVDREVPVIYDDYIDLEFGTGALKVTPAHDTNDYEIGLKHDLPVIDVFNPDGTMSEAAGMWVGEDRFAVRRKAAARLEELGLLEKVEDLPHSVGFSERTDAVIEPRLSLQWFLAMEKLAEPALKAVMEDTVRLIPPKFKGTYRHWMENVRDWCISRQLWWGHRIPAWFYGEGPDDFVVARTPEEALALAREKTGRALSGEDLTQDPDVLDTWASSWLWPISVFDGFAEPDGEVAYYYPTDVLVTAPEILFFWVARMIMAGYEYRGEPPFRDVYLTGIVRDKQRRKMSKSLGNSPDPLDVIRDYGADGMRVGMLMASSAGNDILFDMKLCEQGRNFANKIWNALRLVQGWSTRPGADPDHEAPVAWFEHKLERTVAELDQLFAEFRISEAIKQLYSFVWDDFCSWYLEFIKPAYGEALDEATHGHTIRFFERLLQLLHPFMPFLTEELWHHLAPRAEGQDLIVAPWPTPGAFDHAVIERGELAKAVVSSVRDLRNQHQLGFKEAYPLRVKTADFSPFEAFALTVRKLAVLSAFEATTEEVPGALSFLAGTLTGYLEAGGAVDLDAQRAKAEGELQRLRGFLQGIQRKLSNDRFVAGAPVDVVERERQKQADTERKIAALEEQLAGLR
jgi:valyl-tRNA synthetase